MISFSKLGRYGRLGNQLFQYAFTRVTAQRLGTQFFCPHWNGDDIFNLQDDNERAKLPLNITNYFNPAPQNGFISEALSIGDNTEIQGYFQSEKYYPNKQLVRKWYTFNNKIVAEVEMLYGDLIQQDCVSLSLRAGDYAEARHLFPLFSLDYYRKALQWIKPQGPVIIFSDMIDRAKEFFSSMQEDYDLVFTDNLSPSHSLYLITKCRSNVITNSTFAWWGAWLNTYPDKIVVAPTTWYRSGLSHNIKNILCDDWIKIPGTHPILDHINVWRIRHPVETANRLLKRIGKNHKS